MKAKILCYNCNSPDHIVADCPYKDKRFHNGNLKLKKNKKGGGYVVTWDSDNSDSDDDASSSDDERTTR
jgi:hypothetical protein